MENIGNLALCLAMVLFPIACARKARQLGGLDDLEREYRRGSVVFGAISLLTVVSLTLVARDPAANFQAMLMVNIVASAVFAWWAGVRTGVYLVALGVLLWTKHRDKLVTEWRKSVDPLQTAVWKRYAFALLLGLIMVSKYVVIGAWTMNLERDLAASMTTSSPPASQSTR